MKNIKRQLTGPFEPITSHSSGEEIDDLHTIDNNVQTGNNIPTIIPPALNIVPPPKDLDSVDDRSESAETHDEPIKKNESRMANLFKRGQPNNSPGRRRPRLFLRTTSFSGSDDNRDENISSTSGHSPLTNFTAALRDTRLRSKSAGTRRSSSSVSRGSRAPRSAKVLSFVAADDMDDFQDLQKDFNFKHTDKSFGWLPQLNTDDTGDESSNGSQSGYEDEDEEEIRSRLAPLTPPRRTSSNENISNETPGTTYLGIFKKSPAKVPTTPRRLSFSESSKFHVSHEELADTASKSLDKEDGLAISTYSIELPDFDQPPGKSFVKPLKLYGNSLCLISPTNFIRVKLASIHMSNHYRFAYLVILTAFTVLLAIRTYHPRTYSFLYSFKNWADYINFFIYIYFTVNDVTKIIAFGFWDDSQMFQVYGKEYRSILERIGVLRLYRTLSKKYGYKLIDYIMPQRIIDEDRLRLKRQELNSSITKQKRQKQKKIYFDTPRAYARSSWNRVDLVSTCCFWIGLFLSIRSYDERMGIKVFKPLAVIRILRLVHTDTGISSILRALKYGIPQLVSVGFMLVYFWVFFGILGVQLFQGSLRRQCVWFNPDDPSDTYQYSMQFCGGYLDPNTNEPTPYIYSNGLSAQISKGFLCPVNSRCISNANPYNGRVSFDNIVNSMEIVFVVMSANTFTDIMYYLMDSDDMAACLFFVLAIFVLTIWMMNLLIAVLVSSFEIANEKFKKKKLEKHSNESWPVRFTAGYWRFFQVKASQTDLPDWSMRCLRVYGIIEPVFLSLIMVDLVFRSCVNSNSSSDFIDLILKVDRAISIVLFIETVGRLILYSPNFWKFLVRGDFLFDSIIAVASLVVSSLGVSHKIGHTYYWLSVFQISRFYRVVIAIPFTRQLWKLVLSNGLMIWNLSAFYFFFTFLVAIISSVYMEGIIPMEEMEEYAFGMYSLPNSFLSLFIIGSTENWTEILYAVQQYAPNISTAFFCSVLLIIWFILSNSVILNIFIALISESMDVDENEKRPLQIKHYLQYVYPQKIQEYTHASFLQRFRRKFFKKSFKDDSRDFKQFLIRGTAIMNIAHNMEDLAKEFKDKSQRNEYRITNWAYRLADRLASKINVTIYANNPFYKHPEVLFTETNERSNKSYVLQLNEYEDEKFSFLRKNPLFNYSYFIFPPRHRFRRFCQRLVPPSIGKRTDGIRFYEDDTDLYSKRRYFRRWERDIFVLIYALATLLLIVTSCYVTPLYRMKHNIQTYDWPLYLDSSLVSVFTVEFIVKTIADGFVYSPNAYVRNPWNIIDFVVLISMWIYFIVFLKNDGNLSRLFRGLSALRALRCLTISNTARQTFNLIMFDGMKRIGGAALICLSLLFPFTVWGLGVFNGRLGVCNDGNYGMEMCFNEYTNNVFQFDVMMPRVYSNPYLYFDSFASSFRSLYEIISLEGWVDLLQNLMNSTGVGTIPSLLGNSNNAVFLVLFNFLSMVFILNLFVSFIINNHAKTNGSAYYTIEEKSWLESKKLLTQATPRVIPNLLEMSRFRRFCYFLAVEKKYFYYASFLQVVLYLHIIMLLAISYFDKYYNETRYNDAYFMFSLTVFLFQELVYVIGEGLGLYISQFWNVVRFCVVAISFILSIIGLQLPHSYVWFHNFDDFFHLVIFLFVIPQNNTLSELLETAMASLPPILSLTYTWGILFLVYGMALNQIFGMTRLGANTTGNINFRTVIKAFIVLFRCSFGEGWNYIMDDLTIAAPYCFSDSVRSTTDCGSTVYAYILLMSWNILSMYIFLNMFISLIITNFSYVYRRGSSHSVINRGEIRKFSDAWANLDTDGVGELEFSYLPKLMHSFDGTFSFKIWEGSLTIRNLVDNYMTVNPHDPYDVEVNLVDLNNELSKIDKVRIIARRLKYRRFIQEVHYTNAHRGAIKFGKLLQSIPLYTVYNPRECLGIDEYVRYLYNMGKVDKYLDNERNVDVLDMVVTRWKYITKRKQEDNPFKIIDDKESEQELLVKENSESMPLRTPHLNFGVDNFLWSPKLESVSQNTHSKNTEEERASQNVSSKSGKLPHRTIL
ncbi:similar to Saccharomyces cerevisiae YGR217W CCH1 Voltage-gated high-affinity calcium channel involved in calcium influx in response to some environmental stresses as well as exposure to mating pheromones [Maudiozyma barnettii]|nr:similar to Saccharomyces cerevisiae YGR217W CCH1 Voltage-gated high-affinity calcium channel involved in calcium influx in response to some environmental stresses as well as exposure to mating pheromones [Kazachstania barnettii]